jgi:hypothetical protein
MNLRRCCVPIAAVCLLRCVAAAAEVPQTELPKPDLPKRDVPNLTPSAGPVPLPKAPLSSVEREAAVELPPMIIAETSKAPPWLYANVGGTEYLSRCSAGTTRSFITAQLEIRRMLEVFVPGDFFAVSAVPNVSIIAPLESGSAADDVASREMHRMEQRSLERLTEEERRNRRVPSARTFRFLPNLRLDDRDMLAVFTYLRDRDFRSEKIIAAPDYVFSRLVARTPTLPAWLIEGITGVYQDSSFRDDPITMLPAAWIVLGRHGGAAT